MVQYIFEISILWIKKHFFETYKFSQNTLPVQLHQMSVVVRNLNQLVRLQVLLHPWFFNYISKVLTLLSSMNTGDKERITLRILCLHNSDEGRIWLHQHEHTKYINHIKLELFIIGIIEEPHWVPQKLPQICTVILRIHIGKVAWFVGYICGNFWVTQ